MSSNKTSFYNVVLQVISKEKEKRFHCAEDGTTWPQAVETLTARMREIYTCKQLEDIPEISYRIVVTKTRLEQMFADIEQYLELKMKQDLYLVLVGFGGHEISRTGKISVVSLTLLDGRTWLIDVAELRDTFWDRARSFFSDMLIDKVVWDGRFIADYLLHKHDIRLAGIYDLMILEAIQRGKMSRRAYKPLPTMRFRGQEKSKATLDRKMFRDMSTIMRCYLDKELDCLENLSEKEWDMREGFPRIITDQAIRWLIHYQSFLLSFTKKFNFVKAMFQNANRAMSWWISSATWCATIPSLQERTFPEIENSRIIPRHVLTLDIPFGTQRCLTCGRSQTLSEYSEKMRLNIQPKVCMSCRRIFHNVFYEEKGHVIMKNVDVDTLDPPASVTATFLTKWELPKYYVDSE